MFDRLCRLVIVSGVDGSHMRKRKTATAQLSARSDVVVENHGSIFLFTLRTARARRWVDQHVQEDAQWWAGRLAVEHRYAWDLAQGMAADGLRVR